jgi:hypothetical protein
MNLEKLLQQINGQEKVANENHSGTSVEDSAKNNLQQVLEKVATVSPTPVVQNNPTDALLKVAEQLAGNEKQAELLHASECGRNFANAAIETFAAYDAAVKMAAVQNVPTRSPVQSKLASSSNEELIKMGSEAGYIDTLFKLGAEIGYTNTMNKIAESQFNEGQAAALQEVHKLAQVEFIKGAQEVDALIDLAKAK